MAEAMEKKNRNELDIAQVTTCRSTQQMLRKAAEDGVETAFHRAADMKACPIGADAACCKHCGMGPCRLSSKEPYSKTGVCGATIDTIASRNFARMVASGSASHIDHGMSMLEVFRGVLTGEIKDYQIKDEQKLLDVAASVGIETGGREIHEIAEDLYDELEKTYTQVQGEIPFVKRVPARTLEKWRELKIVPRGAMREVMEIMHRTHMGVDQDYENMVKQCCRTALADGWGGSMVATEISDILFGTPSPLVAEVDMGCLKERHINIVIHGHEPNMFESIIASANDPGLLNKVRAAGAEGINLLGMCCSGTEVMSRHGVPHAGNFMSTEAILITGAVDAMAVDVQCAMQSLSSLSKCYGTYFFTTNPRARIEGAEHIEIDEYEPRICTDRIVCRAIERFKNRRVKVVIPQNKSMGVQGFSQEYIGYMLGGTFRASYVPLNDNIINGRIRGVAAAVGCNNPRVRQDHVHVEVVKELIKNDVLVLQTGCSQIALAKAGLMKPDAAVLAGDGLKEVCEAVGMPPVLGLGSCVDNSRILMACAEMVKTGGLGQSIADLPVAACAPEWMSEKAIAIGQYVVASGIYTVFGATFPSIKGTRFHTFLFEELEKQGLGKWGFTTDPYEMAHLMIQHINKKRVALGIMGERERKLFDMSDRRAVESGEAAG
ncbi:MAG: anaerobic carbon-monoxide dehydrogenase catalytic subunit [Deltaproteobacteria bacterium]|nr:anaerobic carbon-monoxide dehydrogenase catalytic subunit [Deltaproteobacteria bacterium]